MINDIVITPILFFSLIFSSLILSFSLKKSLSDRIIFYFSNFLFVIWSFSLIELSNYFGFLPEFIIHYLSSILLFLLHYFLLFQYLFVSSFLFKSKKTTIYTFIVIYSLWSIFFSSPLNALEVAQGSNQIKQSVFAGVSLFPGIILSLFAIYNLFYKKIKRLKISSFLIIAGLMLPVFVIYQIISVQTDNLSFSLDLIFIALSISMYFYTLLLYLDKERRILSSFRDKVMLITALLVVMPLILRTTYVYSSLRNILISNTTNNIVEANQYHTYNISNSLNKYIEGANILSKIEDLTFIEDNQIAREKTEAIFINYLKNNPGVSEINFVDYLGNEKLKAEQLNGDQSIVPITELANITNHKKFKFPLENQRNNFYVSDIFSTDTEQRIQFVSPVFFSNQIVGLVFFNVDAKEIFSYYLSHNINHNQYIVNLDGEYVYNHDFEKVNNNSNLKDDLNDVWQAIQLAETNSIISDQKDNKHIYNFNKIEINLENNSNDYYIIHEEEVESLFSDIDRLSSMLVGTLMVVTLVVFILAYIMSTYLTKPFIDLIIFVKNYDYLNNNTFKNHSLKEVRDLHNAFVSMIQKVKASKVQISQQVDIQTVQISENSGRLEKQRAAMINLIEDIDSQRKLNLLQATDLKKFKFAIDSVSELIVITDPEGTVIYVNPVVKEITGFTVKDTIGSKAGKLWGGQMSKEWYKNFWHVISEQKEKYVDQITNIRKSGKKFIAQITVQPLVDDIGNIQYYVSVQRDITEQIKIDRMKTDFISLASHQLRTPLSAMKWFLEMMINGDLGKLNSEQMDAVKNVDASNSRMIALVNSLLNISRIESGRIIVNPVEADIVELVKSTIMSVKKMFDEKHQNISFKADTSLPKISLDKDLVSQVLINLLTNASKYTDKDGSISVAIQQMEGNIIVKVSDNGLGIPEKEKDNVFKRFYRASNVIKKDTDGTGLGLYLAKAIIETLSGKIWFESEEGKGTSFWFTIPLSGVNKKEGEVSITLTKN